MKIYKISERVAGKSLAELGHKLRVTIYRAVRYDISVIKNMDYITMSYRFAKEHAEHMAAVEQEDYIVLMVRLNPENVFEAYNPDEYFYKGPDIVARQIYVAKAENFG